MAQLVIYKVLISSFLKGILVKEFNYPFKGNAINVLTTAQRQIKSNPLTLFRPNAFRSHYYLRGIYYAHFLSGPVLTQSKRFSTAPYSSMKQKLPSDIR